MKELEITFRSFDGFETIRSCLTKYVRENLRGNSGLMEVALIEAVNNAMKYGIAKNGNRIIHIKLRIQNGKRLIIRVKDHGPGFEANNRLKEINAEQENAFEKCLYDESGRGLLIMNEAADLVTYNECGNEVLMVKAIPSP